MERITDKYVFFWGSEFSNWYPSEFEYKDNRFSNSEQAFMWEKANHFSDNIIAESILQTPNPGLNKALGRQVANFDAKEWTRVSYQIMVDVCFNKFRQDKELKELLLSTGNKIIVEASPEDRIWGIGMHWRNEDCLDETKWMGQNLLGKALMEVRDRLNNNHRGR